jgi:SNF2 family DNA or RNA helicase
LLILQGTWIPSLSPEKKPCILLWGEYQTAESTSITELELDDVSDAVNTVIGKEHALLFLNENLRAYLPYIKTEFTAEVGSSEALSNISGIVISMEYGAASNVLEMMMSFEQSAHWEQWGFVIGESLIFWSRAARLTLELLSSEHFIPSINQTLNSASWDAVLDDPQVEHRIKSLANDMPSTSEGLNDFIQASVDLFIRECMEPTEIRDIMKSMNPRYIAPLTPSEHWLQALFSTSSEAVDSSLEWIAEEVMDWRTAIVQRRNESAFRTCFRLEQPHSSDTSGKEPVWILRLLLQAADDPSLLVPAELVWKEASETLEYLNYRFHQPQERLLSDLGKAGKLFKPIERSLMNVHPTLCELNTDEAHLFLSIAAEQFNDEGFGVFIPAWWRKPEAQLGVKMKIKSDASDHQVNHRHHYRKDRIGFNAIFEYEWELALGEENISLDDFEQLAALKQPLVQVRGQWVEFQPKYYDDAVRLLEQKGKLKLSEAMHIALNLKDAGSKAMADLYPAEQTQLPVHEIKAEGAAGFLIDRLKNESKMDFLEQPQELKGMLRPYQLKGFSWLVFMRQLQLGACLADDMGLGKTIQWIAYLLHLKQIDELQGPVLLICPTSVLGNWERELERFAPSLKVWLHHGNQRDKGEAFSEKAHEYDVVLTSYAISMRDEADLLDIPWDIVTLDEAQNIKNTTSKQTQSIRKLSAIHRIALTGTPVENRLSELWSIMDFLNAGYLGTKDQFIEKFEVPIERDEEMEIIQLLHRIIQPFVLRRLKSDRRVIEDIPDKHESTTFCSLTREQASLYEACVKSAFEKVEKARGMERRGAILSTITHLKQICNHPVHFLGEGDVEEKRSGKLMRLVSMLQEAMAQGERTLIFTQYARMASMLQQFLTNRFQQEVMLIHGRVPKKKRDEMIRRFQEDSDAPSVFVLSLKTGGFGLNLTRANHVIHYDRWWNPAVENQATDRAYRIGQQKNVMVHKFLCAGTLEEKIDQMMVSKQTLATRVIGKGEAWITEMNTNDLKQLFELRNAALVSSDDELEGSIL